MELNLAPGTYGLSCRVVVGGDNGELIDHFERGMHVRVQVEERSEAAGAQSQ